jgi:OmpA-OmpF porin, OOP family
MTLINKYILISCLLLFVCASVTAQPEPDTLLSMQIEKLKKDPASNLAPNFSFEKYSVCPDGCSVVPKSYFVDNWLMATLGTPDYFNVCSYKSGVPENWVGKLYARTGFAYTGLIPGMYINSNQNLEEIREYIEAKLKEKLIKDEYYFLGFSTALAGASQYAINGIGLYLSDSLIDLNNSIFHLPVKPQLLNKNNEAIKEKFKWTDVSGIFKAKGGENYVVIGNFQSDEDTRMVDTGIPGSLNCSYYLFDDIFVIHLPENRIPVNFVKNGNITSKNNLVQIHFDFGDTTIRPIYKVHLDSLLNTLKINPVVQIEIYGYTDSIGSDTYNQNLSELRAKVVCRYLKLQTPDKIKYVLKGFGERNPFADNGNEIGRALNRRVEIRIK